MAWGPPSQLRAAACVVATEQDMLFQMCTLRGTLDCQQGCLLPSEEERSVMPGFTVSQSDGEHPGPAQEWAEGSAKLGEMMLRAPLALLKRSR